MRYPGDDDHALMVVHGVHDAVITDAQPIVVPTCQLHDSWRPGMDRETADGRRDSLTQRTLQAPIRSGCGRMHADLVGLAARAYVWTSDQGSASSRSSRAWSAARLSSR